MWKWVLSCTLLSCHPLQVSLADGILPSQLHSITAIAVCPGLEDVIMFGGTDEDLKPFESYSRMAGTTVFSFGELSLLMRSGFMVL